ncbi:hypothetical protein DSCO28_00750 [Desulfosarcina ovata subsp. sediminis]|uniref:Sulfotransferase domain-containing protein n=2 Tax=Desulfosarcina ovata TaxID=83564 RepID=A0A5K7ZID0_9BACT|nr:hypothetical protein DSCO28_00750 [Desulfosarcina ovata subsp. sediminis]
MNLPDFLIVGAAKSGTTTLFRELNSYSEVFIPGIKEGRFFSNMHRNFRGGAAAKFQNEGPRDLKEYTQLFSGQDEKVKGDISGDYFYYWQRSIENIKRIYADANKLEPKIVIVLRDPVSRIFSMYHHIIRLRSDTKSFEEVFNLSKNRIKDGYAWMFDLHGVGLSFQAVKAYIDNFSIVKVYLMEDLQSAGFFTDLLAFLEVNEKPKSQHLPRSNENDYLMPKSFLISWILSLFGNIWVKVGYRGNHRNRLLHIAKKIYLFAEQLNRHGNQDSINTKFMGELIHYYKNDVIQLSKLIGRDLSHWLIVEQ